MIVVTTVREIIGLVLIALSLPFFVYAWWVSRHDR